MSTASYLAGILISHPQVRATAVALVSRVIHQQQRQTAGRQAEALEKNCDWIGK
jgi:hypothetical protein